MSNFMNGITDFFDRGSGENSTSAICESKINHYKFFQFALIPAVVLILLLAATRKRREVLLSRLGGRPGLIHPMDTMTRSTRLSYACAFGATALLLYNIVWHQKFAIDYDGPTGLKTLIAIVSMVIYGMVYFPVFACLAVATAFSYGLGSLYIWMLTAVDVFQLWECDFNEKGRIIVITRYLPVLLCDAYLSITFPIRFVTAMYHRRFFTSEEDKEEKVETVEDIWKSYQGKHVRKLLRKPVMPKIPVGAGEKIKAALMGFAENWIYQREPGFRYPSRLLSVMFVAGIIVYVITVEFLVVTVSILEAVLDSISEEIEWTVGWDEYPGEDQSVTDTRETLLVTYYFANLTRICVIVSITVACALSVLTILHMLSSYRMNLFAMYRGDYRIIPSPYEKSASALCVGSIKYAGFQVGYIFWSYIITVLILFIVCMILAVLITLIVEGYTDWLVDLIEKAWPGMVIAFALVIAQTLMAKFFFLQKNGEWLRLDNRRFFFIFTYFMFFYNIFLGLVSCLLRIVKAMIVGILFLARLDNSTLPRRFEFLDPGFSAYQGFIHMEAAHTHPVVLVFIRLLTSLSKQRKKAELSASRNDKMVNIEMSSPGQKYETSNGVKSAEPVVSCRKVNVAARFNWHVLYTLLHNPQVRVYRKGFIQAIRKARKEGVRIPISDRPITDFDLVKALEDREKEIQEESKRTVADGPGKITASWGGQFSEKSDHSNGSTKKGLFSRKKPQADKHLNDDQSLKTEISHVESIDSIDVVFQDKSKTDSTNEGITFL